MEYITSRQNPLMTHLRKLNGSREYRRTAGEFLCDGTKLLDEALRWGAAITTIVVAEGVAAPSPEGVRMVEVPRDVFASVSPMESPQGVLFLCKTPDLSLGGLGVGRYLILDGLQDPGNVGTIWRTADAFGADGLILVHDCADPFSCKAVRASMGAAFRLPLWESTPGAVAKALNEAGIPLYGTALRADTDDVRVGFPKTVAVVIGSEGRGISKEMLDACARTIQIPMMARCESLNAAAAATVVLWEMYR